MRCDSGPICTHEFAGLSLLPSSWSSQPDRTGEWVCKVCIEAPPRGRYLAGLGQLNLVLPLLCVNHSIESDAVWVLEKSARTAELAAAQDSWGRGLKPQNDRMHCAHGLLRCEATCVSLIFPQMCEGCLSTLSCRWWRSGPVKHHVCKSWEDPGESPDLSLGSGPPQSSQGPGCGDPSGPALNSVQHWTVLLAWQTCT